MQKLNIVLISLLSFVSLSSYADCPTVGEILVSKGQGNKKYILSNKVSIWYAETDLQQVNPGLEFSHAVSRGNGYNVTVIVCAYTAPQLCDVSDRKTDSSKCELNLSSPPSQTYTLGQASGWVETPVPDFYRVFDYACTAKNNQVNGCPFTILTNKLASSK